MENNMNLISFDELIDNPTPRVPVCLCLDVSASMSAVEDGDYKPTGKTVFQDGKEWQIVEGGRTRIDELQKGVQLFFDAVKEDEIATYAAEIAIITFNDTAKCIREFSGLSTDDTVPKLVAEGTTAMGEAVDMALEKLAARKEEYKKAGVDYYQPWLIIMSDGEPNGDENIYRKAVQESARLVNDKKLAVFAVGIGAEADLAALSEFSPKRPAIRLQKLKFREFFEWLSQSVSRTSQSMPGDAVKLDLDAIKGWGEL